MAALAVVETPSGKDAIAEGLLGLLKPAVQQLDLHVHSVRWVAGKIFASTSIVLARYCSLQSQLVSLLDTYGAFKTTRNKRGQISRWKVGALKRVPSSRLGIPCCMTVQKKSSQLELGFLPIVSVVLNELKSKSESSQLFRMRQ